MKRKKKRVEDERSEKEKLASPNTINGLRIRYETEGGRKKSQHIHSVWRMFQKGAARAPGYADELNATTHSPTGNGHRERERERAQKKRRVNTNTSPMRREQKHKQT